MAETTDYAELLPKQPPEGAMLWCRQTMLPKEYGIYKDAGGKHDMVQVTCTRCGHSWRTPKIKSEGDCIISRFGFLDREAGIVGNGEKARCPHCGWEIIARYTGDISACGVDENDFFMSHTRIGGNFALLGWRVERNIGKDAVSTWRIWPYEAYVFERRKTIRLNAYTKCMAVVSCTDRWVQRKKYKDAWRETKANKWYRRPKAADIAGTTAENSALIQYLEAAGEGAEPVSYLHLWQKHRNVENLVVQGCGELVAAEIREDISSWNYNGVAKLPWIDWKQRKPSAMLGLNKSEFAQCAKERWTKDQLEAYKMVRAVEPVDLLRDMPLIKAQKPWYLEKLISRRGKLTVMRCLRYLQRQNERAEMLLDYWTMAQRAGLNMDDDHVRLPKRLRHEHNRLMQDARIKEKAAEIEKRRPQFEAAVAKVADWRWEHDGICIRPARTEVELIKEGTNLNHCVGGYGPTVAKGESCIFFIRRTKAPDESWYTLQVDIAGIRELQNHGKDNRAPTEEVRDFVRKWLEHVRQLEAGRRKRKEGAA